MACSRPIIVLCSRAVISCTGLAWLVIALGSLAAADDGDSLLIVLSASGDRSVVLSKAPAGSVIGTPDWSNDGQAIVFHITKGRQPTRDPYFEAYDGDSSLFLVAAAGGDVKNLGAGMMPCWSPDDRLIAFARCEIDLELWIINCDGTGLERLNCYGASPRWSPDRRQLAVVVPGGAGLRLYDLKTGSVRRAVKSIPQPRNLHDMRPGFDWSPDGRRICGQWLSVSDFPALRDEIYILEVATATARVRWREPTGSGFAWSPDGKQILFSMRESERANYQLFVLDPDTDAPPRKVPGQDPNRSNKNPAWSPDGKQIVFVSEPINVSEPTQWGRARQDPTGTRPSWAESQAP